MTYNEETGRTAATTTTILVDVMFHDDRIDTVAIEAPDREDVWESIRAFDALCGTHLYDQIYSDYSMEDRVYLMLSDRTDDEPVMTVRDAEGAADLLDYLEELGYASDEELTVTCYAVVRCDDDDVMTVGIEVPSSARDRDMGYYDYIMRFDHLHGTHLFDVIETGDHDDAGVHVDQLLPDEDFCPDLYVRAAEDVEELLLDIVGCSPQPVCDETYREVHLPWSVDDRLGSDYYEVSCWYATCAARVKVTWCLTREELDEDNFCLWDHDTRARVAEVEWTGAEE